MPKFFKVENDALRTSAHRSLLTVHCSPFTAHRSLLTVHCSPFTAHRSLITELSCISLERIFPSLSKSI